MTKGLGSDIIEIERIRQTINRHGSHFFKKVFTEQEIDYCLKHQDPALSFAGRFSAKEAIAKALGTGFGKHVSFSDISIENDENGRPYPIFSDRFNEFFDSPQILISISHCKLCAMAVAIWI
ncbi:holo-ACP synthase [Simkania negevensis]|uniref:Holo-[acyl-carrier-protein] synthase n=1 Tax=Simkania negevensis (strain ATCC VR-1471 / DSM 27360 / Z) TaxID=331113 RepID=F8L7I4_SIMNZ|nr:holo-ACP synthase [Simkania negevensis]CCB88717.1 holo-[acyl-carrier-protein] synthase [Simkania negevensis Z]